MTSPRDTKDQGLDFAQDYLKVLRPAPGAAEAKKDASGADIQAMIAKVMSGEANVEEALSLYPGIVATLQRMFGNDAIAILMGGKKGGDAPESDGKSTDGADSKGGAGGKGGHGGVKIGIGGVAGKMLDAVKGKAAADADQAKEGQNPASGKDSDEGKDAKGSKGDSKSDSKDGKDGKKLPGFIKGLDPFAGIKDALKHATKGDAKDGKSGADDKDGKGHKDAASKSDDKLGKAIADKSDLKGGGMATNGAVAVQDAAAAVANKKDDGGGKSGGGGASGSWGDGKKDDGKFGGGKSGGGGASGSWGDGKKDGGSWGGGKSGGGGASGSWGDGKKGDGKKDDGKKDDGGKAGADGKGGDPGKEAAEDKKNPLAQDAQKAKEDAGKDGGGGGPAVDEKGGPAADGKEGAGGGGPAAEGKEGAEVAAGGPGPGTESEGGGGGGGAPAPAAPTVKGTLEQYLKAHPDQDAQKRVDEKGFANDKLARDANVLKSNIQPAPDKSWMDAVTPRQEWFAFKKGVMGPNKWTGQDAALDFMTRLNAALESIGGAASKVGLAATIGGAILTLLVPPVGAFLLSVGRVCNAISLVCSALRIVTSIVSTIMLAVKAAKEKDPIKRLEMMQEMKQNVQAGVMAGLDVIMSKLGGKGGGGAAAGVGGKSLEAAKAAFKEGFKKGGAGVVGAIKGVAIGAVGFVKVGAQTAIAGVKQAGRDAIAGIKGQVNMMRQLGVKGTLKAVGTGVMNTVKSMGAGLKEGLTEKFVKPFTDLKSAWKSCGQFRQNWADFRTMIRANGGGASGYLKTIQQLNFPNFRAGAGWKQNASAVFGDMTNVSKGGYASQVMAGMEGKESSHKYRQKTDGTFVKDADGNKILDTAKYRKGGVFQGAGSTSAGGNFASEKLEELAKLKKVRESGSDLEKRKAVHGDTKQGVLANELHARGEAKSKAGDGSGGLADRHSASKNSVGTQSGGMAYVVPGATPNSYLVKTNLDWQLEQKIKKMEDGFKMVNPNWGKMAWDAGTGAYAVSQGNAEWSDVAKGAVKNTGAVGTWGVDTFGPDSSEKKSEADKKSSAASKEKWGDWGQVKLGGGYAHGVNTIGGTVMNTASAAGKKGLEDAGKKADANREAAVKAYAESYQAKDGSGVTAGKVDAATSPAIALIKQRENDIKSSMLSSGPKTASLPTGDAAGGAASSAVSAAVSGGAAAVKQPPPPPPPAPPEGTTIPSMDLIPQIAAQRAKIAKIKADVQADIKASEEIKTQAIGADAQMVQYAAGLQQQATEIGTQKAEATKDVSDVQKAKTDIAAGGKQVGEKKGAAEAEKGKTEAKASEGKAVQNPQVDEGKKKAEENKKAAEEKAAWDREYASAGTLKRGWMNTKKFIGGVLSWVAKAAKWVWEKVIKVAIEAVKKAVAKVLGFITDLMMKGILALVKCFLSKEEGARLDETMAEMKKVEAEQAKKGTEETAAKNEEAKMKLTDAQQAAKAKIDHADGNIQTGKQLLAQADANKTALDQEEADVKAKNEAFKTTYGPYFEWVAKYEAEQAAGSGGEGGKDAGAAVAAGAEKAKQAASESKDGGGAKDGVKGPGAGVKTPAANEGKKEDGKAEHPADKKLDPAIAAALQNAVAVVIAESQGCQGEVARAAGGKSSKVVGIAVQVGRQNEALIKTAGQKGDQAKLGSILAEEGQKTAAVEKAAGNVKAGVVGNHSKAEQERQGRLAALQGKAGSLSQMSLAEGIAAAQGIAKELSREAKAIDQSRNEAMMELDKGFSRSLGQQR